MRDTKELLELLKERYLKKVENKRLFGLCNAAEDLSGELVIDAEEFEHLESYIREHRPFNIRTLKGGNSDGYFYWDRHKVKPRIKWLNKHIKRNSKIF